jgi:putative FmdB family regulatory protein
MPYYEYRCGDCGHDFEVVKSMSKHKEPEACRACGQPEAQRRYSPVGINGGDWAGGKYSKQLGRSFGSVAEVDAYCQKEGLEPVATNSARWQGIRNRNREARERDARAEGFRDAEHRHSELSTNSRDIVAANRQAKIDEYHSEHGSAGRRTVDDAQVWGGGLETKS